MEPAPYFELAFHIPDVQMQADYTVDGKLLVVPFKGSGKSQANLSKHYSVTALLIFTLKFNVYHNNIN